MFGLVAVLMGYVARDPRREPLKTSDGQGMQAVAPPPVYPEAVFKLCWDEVVSAGEATFPNRAATQAPQSPDSSGEDNAAVAGLELPEPSKEAPERVAMREQCIRFVRQNSLPRDPGEAQWIELKNEAWNLLRNDPGAHEIFEGLVLDVLADATQPEVFRNYALQHLGAWLLEGRGGHEALGRVWQASREVESSIGGTALIALAALSGEPGRVRPGDLAQALQDAIRSPNSSDLSLIAAIQVGGEVGLQGAEAAVLALAGDGARSVPVRMAAIAALGTLSQSRTARTLLRRLESDPDSRLRRVAADGLLRWQH